MFGCLNSLFWERKNIPSRREKNLLILLGLWPFRDFQGRVKLVRSRHECRFTTPLYPFCPSLFSSFPFTFYLVTLLLCYSRLNFLSPFLLFSFLRSPQLVALVFLCSIFPAGVVVTGIVPGIVPGNIKLNQCELAALCQYISVAVLWVSVNGRFCQCKSVAIFVCVRLWLYLSV